MEDNFLGITHEAFVKRLKESQKAVEFVQKYIESKGYKTEVPELRIAPDQKSRADYSDEGDLYFYRRDGTKVLVEVKKRTLLFKEKYPYKDIIVNSITGYRTKPIKPDIHLILSKDSKYAVVVKKETFSNWKLKKIYDRIKKRELLFYFADREDVDIIKLV